MSSNEKKVGLAILMMVAAATAVAVWNFYVAFLLLPLVFSLGVFGTIVAMIAKNLGSRSRNVRR